MSTINNLLFDLDGTIIEPEEGILNSLKYAYQKINEPVPPKNELLQFIGPPLIESFTERYKWPLEKANQAIAFYREQFAEKGVFENHLYSGIEILLQKLSEQGIQLFLATSKPTVFAKQILDFHKLTNLFQGVVGSNLDNTRGKKTEIIAYVLEYFQLDTNNCVMIGDRNYDIVGAKNNSLRSIGVTYGHGSPIELQQAGADHIVQNVQELSEKVFELTT